MNDMFKKAHILEPKPKDPSNVQKAALDRLAAARRGRDNWKRMMQDEENIAKAHTEEAKKWRDHWSPACDEVEAIAAEIRELWPDLNI